MDSPLANRHSPLRLLTTRAALIALSLLVGGCGWFPKDITQTPEVQASGVVGRILVLEEDATLYRIGLPYPRNSLWKPDHSGFGHARETAVLTPGTRLRIERVVEATVYRDLLFTVTRQVTFARIEDGPHRGKSIDLGWGGLPIPGETPKDSRFKFLNPQP